MMENADSMHNNVGPIFDDLCNPKQATRKYAMVQLHNYVVARGLSTPSALTSTSSVKWQEEVGRNLIVLVKSQILAQMRGAILAIDVILEIIKEDPLDNRINIFRFYNHLTKILGQTQDTSILTGASRSLGRLIQIGGSVLGENFVEEQIPLFLEKEVDSPFSTILALKELARHSPTSFFPHLSNILLSALRLLRNAQIGFRLATAQLMGYILAAMGPREFQSNRELITSIVERVQRDLESNSIVVLHGSLLALREFFLYAEKDFLLDHFLEMCEAVLRFRVHADASVRSVVMNMIPILARFDQQVFRDQFFLRFMVYLVERLDSTDGPTAYLAIGHLSSSVQKDLIPFIDAIFRHVKSALQKHTRQAPVLVDHVFDAIGLLVRSMGPAIRHAVNDQLELIFTCELSESLVRMLEIIVRYIPTLLGVIQARLLDRISEILCGERFQVQGAPRLRGVVDAISPSTTSLNKHVALALNVLGSFDFKGHLLNEFIVKAVIPYLDNEETATRKAAALTTCRLLARDPIRNQISYHALGTLRNTLDKLLSVGIVDSEPTVRHTVLSSLGNSLDEALSRAEYVRMLVIALHDEVVENRILAMQIVGRLANLNPGDVLPPLRKTLIRLLTELKCSFSQQSKESAIRILAALLTVTRAVVERHVNEVLSVLLDCSRDSNPAVTTHILICLGQLTTVDDTALVSREIPRMMAIILSSLSGSSQTRSAALDCLGRLCTNVGYVVVPMEQHPQLLPLLHGMLKREQSHSVRLQVIKVIGLLGALDPVQYQVKVQGLVMMEYLPEAINIVQGPEIEKPPSPRSSLIPEPDDPYEVQVVDLLLGILQKPSLSIHHHSVIDSLITIAKTRGVKFAPSVPKFMPTFCDIIREAIPSLQDYYLGQLTFLVRAIGGHVRGCVKNIIELIQAVWDTLVSQRLPLIVLVEALADALASEFGPYVAGLIPKLLPILQEEKTEALTTIHMKALAALAAFASNLHDYLNLIVPIIISCYECRRTPFILRKEAIRTLTSLSSTVDLYPYTSRIVHSLIPLLRELDEPLHEVVVHALRDITYTLGANLVIFIPTLTKTLLNNKTDDVQEVLGLFANVLHNEPLPPLKPEPDIDEAPPAELVQLPNPHLLKRIWDVSRVSDSHEAWIAWFSHLAAQFSKESPSASLRSCMNLFDIYPDIAAMLFNPALASCWEHLSESFQEDLIQTLQHVMSSPSVPPEVAHYMLDLVEYMERRDKPLPVSHSSMADSCFRLQAYAKALHHRELQFFQDFAPSTIEALIEIYAMLRQGDAALGTLNLARQHYDVRNPESWYEKLGQWSDALRIYERKEDSRDGTHDVTIGKLRCLHALGEWEQVTTLAAQQWSQDNNTQQSILASLGAAGAWHTGSWKPLETYFSAMARNSGDRAFYSAVSCVQQNRLSDAMSDIYAARDLLDPELTSLLDESPDRLDRFAVQAQMLSELEEVILYRQLSHKSERRPKLRETWKKRLDGCQREPNVWQRILRVRSLAIKPEDDIDTIVRFANLCRKSGRLEAAKRSMESLVQLGCKAPPQIMYAHLKCLWASGDHASALSSIQGFIEALSQNPMLDNPTEAKTIAHILARCHRKHGNWQVEIDGGLTAENAGPVLKSYKLATEHNSQWSKAWHTWALSNWEVVRACPGGSDSDFAGTESATHRTSHLVAAVGGFFHSVSLMGQNNLQDALSLLTLWFRYGAEPEVTKTMIKGFKGVTSTLWLDVVPQIIARIQTPIPIVREALLNLLANIGLEHPQALVYPLTVGAKSPSLPRKTAALKILSQMSSHSGVLVEQAKLVARELCRVAISWGELWCEALQRSGHLFGSGDSKAFLDHFQPLYDLLQDPSTPFEQEFKDVIGPALEDARALCRRHRAQGDKSAFDHAWGLYLRVYQQLEANLPDFQATTHPAPPSKILDLHLTSPRLLRAVNLELAVPGTYMSGRPVVRIASFRHMLNVLSTKQRPRKLTVLGNDGQRYLYLLKGREDLRQDERVMQVIGLVNTLLAKDRQCLDRRLHQQRYTVVPLAPDVGLIGWMARTDPLQQLVTDYRKNHHILPDLEHQMMLKEEPGYDVDRSVTLARKLEIFESVLSATTGQDLYRILWLKSDSSEAWVTRRTTYTRSLAVGNMVCYILGVGDRHPGNIMLDHLTGKVIHIDFGDCFEVSFEREILPEKVPFRLTRMLRHAMEVCGIQGGFKVSCEISLAVFRDNKESLLAVLEALVYDPLINWRLIQADTQTSTGVVSSFGSIRDGPNRRTIPNEAEVLDDAPVIGSKLEVRNERALAVYSRVEGKLTGRDFGSEEPLSVPTQVERLFQQAMSNENLCQHFHGWCPFW